MRLQSFTVSLWSFVVLGATIGCNGYTKIVVPKRAATFVEGAVLNLTAQKSGLEPDALSIDGLNLYVSFGGAAAGEVDIFTFSEGALNSVTHNSDLWSEIGVPVNHLGGTAISAGTLYIPVQYCSDDPHKCLAGHVSNVGIAAYRTNNLTFVSYTAFPISPPDASAIAILGSILYVAPGNDMSTLWKYNLSDLSYVGKLSTHAAINNPLQSLTYNSEDDLFYGIDATKRIIAIDPNTGAWDGRFQTITSGAIGEGFDYRDSMAYALTIDGNRGFLTILTPDTALDISLKKN
jgi:hypothetical protein